MSIFIHDTRDKLGKHKNVEDYLTQKGHKIIRSKLYVGDLTLLMDQHICIDLKRDISELATDVCQDHKRFREELQRAYEAEINLVILVENRDGINDLSELPRWVNPCAVNSPLAPNGERIFKICRAMSGAYFASFQFCHPGAAGRVCEEILLSGKYRRVF